MGHWSVYCSLSNIAIGSGRPCVLLPLKINRDSGLNYDKYLPATLPIFGEYDEYGGIENIVENTNTETIERIYGCTIEEFCKFLLCTRRDYTDDYSDWYQKEHLSAIEHLKYMWVDLEVWNFMKNYHPKGESRAGDFNMGNHELLTDLGFTLVGDSGIERYTQLYKYKDTDFHLASDGRWVHNIKQSNDYIFDMEDLATHGVDVSKYLNIEQQQAYSIFTYERKVEMLGPIIGVRDIHMFGGGTTINLIESLKKLAAAGDTNITEEFITALEKKLDSPDAKDTVKIDLAKEYVKLIETDDYICSTLADMVTIRKNMWACSKSWEPYVQFTTIQDGEYNIHQGILEGFAKINKKILKKRR
jgi:hypothetical protein